MATNKPLQSILLTSAASSVTFSNVDQTYTDLVIVMNSGSINNDDVDLTFNGDTTSNYSRTILYGNGTTAGSHRYTGASNFSITYYGNPSAQFSWISNVHINNYSNATTYKTVLCKTVNADTYGINYEAGLWRSTAAITSVKLASRYSSFAAGSTFDLYGIGVGAPKASGGDSVTTDGNYWYHTFKSSGIFTPQYALTADYLVVAGGGAGGNRLNGGGTMTGGGGGAGGYRTASAVALTPSNYSVVIGAGGTNGVASYSGTNGSDSSFNTMLSSGGGGGSMGNDGGGTYNGSAGGSGGGAGGSAGGVSTGGASSPVTSPVQGYAGGPSNGASRNSGGGGGGSGGTTTTTTAGVGTANSISGSSITYAAGGVGGTDGTIRAGAANTGNGGGGTNLSGATYAGSTGGSGIVIVRYAV